METDLAPKSSGVLRPGRPVSRRTAEPILYLADRMASADQEAVPRELRAVDMVADACGLPTFRHQPWFREMTETAALGRLNTDLAKRAALVTLALVLKSDAKRKPSEHAFFRRIRESLGAPPITVPVDLEEHRRLVLAYFQDDSARRPGKR
jgi:hypothetical protein